MGIEFTCTSCGHQMDVPDRYAGRELFCTACKARFVVPSVALPGALPPSTPDQAESGGMLRVAAAASRSTTIPCLSCGAQVATSAAFCSRCGLPADVDAAGLTRRPGVVTLLAALNFCGGGLWAVVAVVGLAAISEKPAMLVLFGIASVLSVLQIACGVGLWRLRSWGRKLQVGLAVVGLLAFPMGTLISILTLIYMLKPELAILFSGRAPSSLNARELTQLVRLSSSSAVPIVVAVAAVVVIGTFMTGIVAAIAIPNLVNAINRAREKRTMTDIRTVAISIEAYKVDNRAFPRGITSIERLKPLLSPTYVRQLPTTDAWNRPLDVQTAKDGGSYEIVSFGKDGQPDQRPGGSTVDPNADIVFRDGAFVQWPERVKLDR
jgi:general secretion pathway protein G